MYVYIHIHMFVCIYIYIYTYIYRSNYRCKTPNHLQATIEAHLSARPDAAEALMLSAYDARDLSARTRALFSPARFALPHIAIWVICAFPGTNRYYIQPVQRGEMY